jgi:hypothetical protein
MTSEKLAPLWRTIRLLVRIDMGAGIAMAAILFVWLNWH